MSSPMQSAYGAIKRKAEDSLEARMLKHKKLEQSAASPSVTKNVTPIAGNHNESRNAGSPKGTRLGTTPLNSIHNPTTARSFSTAAPRASGQMPASRPPTSRYSTSPLSSKRPPPHSPARQTTHHRTIVELLSDSEDDHEPQSRSLPSIKTPKSKLANIVSASPASNSALPKSLLQHGGQRHRGVGLEGSTSVSLPIPQRSTSEYSDEASLFVGSHGSSSFQSPAPRAHNTQSGQMEQEETSFRASEPMRSQSQDIIAAQTRTVNSASISPPTSTSGTHGDANVDDDEASSDEHSSDTDDSGNDSEDETADARKTLAYARQVLKVIQTRKLKEPQQNSANHSASASPETTVTISDKASAVSDEQHEHSRSAPISMHKLYEQQGPGRTFGSSAKSGMQIVDFDAAARLLPSSRTTTPHRPRDAGELAHIRQQAAKDAAQIRADQTKSHDPQILAAIKAQARKDAELLRSGQHPEPIDIGNPSSSTGHFNLVQVSSKSSRGSSESANKAASPESQLIPESEVTKDDWDLVNLRERGSSWEKIRQEIGNDTRDETFYRRRYAQMRATFPSSIRTIEKSPTPAREHSQGSNRAHGYAFPTHRQLGDLPKSHGFKDRPRKIEKNDRAPIQSHLITSEDFYLVDLVKEGLNWQQIQELCEARSQQQRHSDWYRKRYRRMHFTFPDEIPPHRDAIVLKHRRQPAPAYTGGDIMKTIVQPEADKLDAEDSGIETGATVKTQRPTTGGKTISPEMAHYFVTRSPSPAPSETPSNRSSAAVEDPNFFEAADQAHYVYEARRKFIPANFEGDTDDIEWVVISEKATENKAFANLAGNKAQYQYDRVKPIYAEKWIVSYDEHDLVHLVGTGRGGTVLVEATRKLQDYHDGFMPSNPTGFMARTVYEVFEKVSTTTTVSVLLEQEEYNGADPDVDSEDTGPPVPQNNKKNDDAEQAKNEHEWLDNTHIVGDEHDELFEEPTEKDPIVEAESVVADSGSASGSHESHKEDGNGRHGRFATETTDPGIENNLALQDSNVDTTLQALQNQHPTRLQQWSESERVETSERLVFPDKLFTHLHMANGDARDYVHKLHTESKDRSIIALLPPKWLGHVKRIGEELDNKVEKCNREDSLLQETIEGKTLYMVVHYDSDEQELVDREQAEELKEDGMLKSLETMRTTIEVQVRSRRIEGPRNP